MESYLIAMLTFACLYGLLAVSLNLSWGLTGMVNLGLAGFACIGAYASALTLETLPWLAAVGLGALIAAIAAVIVAVISLVGGARRDQVTRSDVEWKRLKRHQRVLEDYALQLRNVMEDAGLDVPPWPKELTQPEPER